MRAVIATTLTQSVNGLTPTVTFNQAFNAAGSRTELKATIGSTLDFRNTYQYDTLQRMTEIVQQGQSGGNAVTSKRATIAYNALGQRTTLARFQSTGTTNAVATTDYSYDSINRLSSLTHKQGSTTLAGYTYSYDALSRPTSINSVLDGVSTFTYDATSQLTGADHSSQVDESYGFDANGNRNTSGYTTATNNRTTAAPGFTFTYDDEGNRTSKTETATGKVTEYTWDYRNRLTTVRDRNTSGGAVVKQVDYQYDAFNRLVRRTFDADGAGAGSATNQYWVYDGGINAVLQFDGSAASNVSHRYLWSDNVDELIANEQIGSDTLYGLGDHLGTIRDIANFNEGTSVTSVTNHRKYDSFGKLISESNSAVDLIFGFTGKQLDEATGLQHNLFRWYDSALGQWLSEDPIGFAAGDENIRRYVGNDVISRSDPTGLYSEGDDDKKPGHTQNKQEKNRNTHEEGDTRRDVDGNKNEKGDARRRDARKRPNNHSGGPWPPKPEKPQPPSTPEKPDRPPTNKRPQNPRPLDPPSQDLKDRGGGRLPGILNRIFPYLLPDWEYIRGGIPDDLA